MDANIQPITADTRAGDTTTIVSTREDFQIANCMSAPVDLFQLLDDLSPKTRFNRCMEQITHGLNAFLDIADPLRQMEQEKLYRFCLDRDGNPLYRNFGEFLKAVCNMTPSSYCKLCKASDTYQLLKENFGDDTDARLKSLKTLAGLYELSQIPEAKLIEAVEAITDDSNPAPTVADVSSWRLRTLPPDDGPRKRGRPRKAVLPADSPVPDGPVIDAEASVISDEAASDVQNSEDFAGAAQTAGNSTTVTVTVTPAEEPEGEASEDAEEELDDEAEEDFEEEEEDTEEEEFEEEEQDPGEQEYDQLCELLRSYRLFGFVAEHYSERAEDLGERLERFWENVGERVPAQEGYND